LAWEIREHVEGLKIFCNAFLKKLLPPPGKPLGAC
jgi:hypothetical protein